MRTVLNAILAVLCLSIGLAASVMAEQLQDWEAAYRRNDFTTAYRLLRPLADGGDVNAQYNLGVMLRDGRGVPQNSAEAATWFRKAAQQGLVPAQYNLGVMLFSGQDVERNLAEAVAWFRKAAEQGMAQAQYNLGVSLRDGQGGLRIPLRLSCGFARRLNRGM
jgi:TPR repeat protein